MQKQIYIHYTCAITERAAEPAPAATTTAKNNDNYFCAHDLFVTLVRDRRHSKYL